MSIKKTSLVRCRRTHFCLWDSKWKRATLAVWSTLFFSAQRLRTVCWLLLWHLQDWGGLPCQGVNWHRSCCRKNKWLLAIDHREGTFQWIIQSRKIKYFDQTWTVIRAAVSLCCYDCQMSFLPPLATDDFSLWCLKRSCRMFAPCTHVTCSSPVPLFMQVAPSSPSSLPPVSMLS